jgi:hypothetical protein
MGKHLLLIRNINISLQRTNKQKQRTTNKQSIDGLLGQGVNRLFRIDQLYGQGSPEQKNIIIGSMFPEKLTSDGNLLRTGRVNEVARIIFTLDKGFSENKKGQKSDFTPLSCVVTLSGPGSNRWPADLERLAALLPA